jgi:hypothetical protein
VSAVPLSDFERRRRGKNLALAGVLFGLAVLFFVITLVRWHS